MFGAGGMAAVWLDWFLPELAERSELVGLVEIDRRLLDERGDALGLGTDRRFTDIDAAVDAVRSGYLDATCAVVVLPARFHSRATIACARAGLHVLTEKPLADTWADCLAIAGSARGPAKVAVVQNYRYSPAVREARRLLQTRRLGAPRFVAARFRADYREFGSWSGPARHRMSRPVLEDAAVHHLDQIRHLLGLEFTEVACDEWRPGDADGFRGACCVSLLARLESGVRASYEANLVCAGEQRSWMGEEYRIECADGAIVVVGEQLRMEISEGDTVRIETMELDPMPVRYHLTVITEFFDWVEGAEFRGSTVGDNLHTMRAVFAAMRAAETHAWVRVEEIGDIPV
jgi:predicted dehydrogenase